MRYSTRSRNVDGSSSPSSGTDHPIVAAFRTPEGMVVEAANSDVGTAVDKDEEVSSTNEEVNEQQA